MNSFSIHRIWLFLTIHGSLAYFHIPSYVEFQSPEVSNSFGYSIGYLSSSNSLVVGDPLNGEDGKVYSCSITGLDRKTSTCENTEININEYAGNYNKSGSPNQKFCLGASISVTPDYFLTCAPLWSSYTLSSMFGALGTCFISNGTYVERYFGLTEKYYGKDSRTKIVDIYGGIGWNTLSDSQNNIILIAKPVLESSISYIDMDQPMNPAKVINLGEVLYTFGYVGQGLAVGQFFDTKTLYAVSMIRRTKTTGAVMFLYYDTTLKILKIYLNDNYEPMVVEDSAVDSMYGVILHSVNLNFDNFTELLVGAPAQGNTFGGYEQGAVHIYVGEATTKDKTSSNLCIYGTIDGSRFGTAVASTDLDGDGLSEIFISAPYEDRGVIYVLPGCEISALLHKDRNSLVAVNSLRNIQRIVNSDTKAFGTSLLSMTDVDKNGLNALAIGSLNSNKLLLYKSMPIINVTTYTILDGEIVREQDKNFTVTVSVHITYTTKQKIINGKLFVTTYVDGVGATIANSKYEIKLNENITMFHNNVVVLFNHHEQGDYKFTAIVEADRENLKRSDYDKSLYIINPYSRVRDAVDVKRRCRGNDCVPKLSLKIEWTGGDFQYVLGSSEKENMTLFVRNDGNDTYQSCARVRINGAQFKMPDCVLEVDNWYRCDFIKIPRHGTYPVELQLDMTKRTSRDKNLVVDVSLFNNCAAFSEETVKESKIITYYLNTTEVYIEGLNLDRNVTDSVIKNDEIQDIDIHEAYVVINNGTVIWKSVRAVIELKKETYIKNYTVTTFNTKHCSEDNTESSLRIICIFDLNPNSVAKFLTSINIIKKEIMDNFEDGKLSVTSNYTVYLEPTAETLFQTLTTTLSYQVDGGFGNNKNLIISLSVLIGLFILVVVIIVLCKVGFFKRAEKTKLDALKEEIRRESTRRPALKETCSADNDNSKEDSANLKSDIEVIEYDIPLHDGNTQNTGDSVVLIAEACL